MRQNQRTILVIDDSPEDRETYCRYLLQDSTYTYTILSEEYGENGLALCRQVLPDAILLDFLLPDINGLEFLSELQTQIGRTNLPVVMLTGQGNEAIAVQAMKSGASDYLIKGKTTPESLCLAIHNVVERVHLWQLEQSAERFRTSVENMLDCFGIYTSVRDESGRIVDFLVEYVNAAACVSNRMSQSEQIGKRLLELLPFHRETGLFDEYCQLVETGKPLLKEALVYADIERKQYRTRAFDIRAAKLDDGFVAVWRDITDHKQAVDKIKASLQEKEVLLKEIHPQLKNNLQLVSSLLNLQSEYIQNQQTLEILKATDNRVASIALIYAQLYQSENSARIDFAEYIQTLAANLFSSYDVSSARIVLQLNVEPVQLSIDVAIPCGLIINELVANSLKYAFPKSKSGEIHIELHGNDDNRFTLLVSDNGIGFPQELDFRNTESLGLQLVNLLTTQLEGNIELNRNMGTEFKLTFPLNKKLSIT